MLGHQLSREVEDAIKQKSPQNGAATATSLSNHKSGDLFCHEAFQHARITNAVMCRYIYVGDLLLGGDEAVEVRALVGEGVLKVEFDPFRKI